MQTTLIITITVYKQTKETRETSGLFVNLNSQRSNEVARCKVNNTVRSADDICFRQQAGKYYGSPYYSSNLAEIYLSSHGFARVLQNVG